MIAVSVIPKVVAATASKQPTSPTSGTESSGLINPPSLKSVFIVHPVVCVSCLHSRSESVCHCPGSEDISIMFPGVICSGSRGEQIDIFDWSVGLVESPKSTPLMVPSTAKATPLDISLLGNRGRGAVPSFSQPALGSGLVPRLIHTLVLTTSLSSEGPPFILAPITGSLTGLNM